MGTRVAHSAVGPPPIEFNRYNRTLYLAVREQTRPMVVWGWIKTVGQERGHVVRLDPANIAETDNMSVLSSIAFARQV